MKMKRFLSLTCAAVLLFSLSACNGRELPPYLRNPETTAPTTSTTEPTTVTITRPLTYQFIVPGVNAEAADYPKLQPYYVYRVRSDGETTKLYDEPVKQYWPIDGTNSFYVYIGNMVRRVSPDRTEPMEIFTVEGELLNFNFKTFSEKTTYAALTQTGLYVKTDKEQTSFFPMDIVDEPIVLELDIQELCTNVIYLTATQAGMIPSENGDPVTMPVSIEGDILKASVGKENALHILLITENGLHLISLQRKEYSFIPCDIDSTQSYELTDKIKYDWYNEDFVYFSPPGKYALYICVLSRGKVFCNLDLFDKGWDHHFAHGTEEEFYAWIYSLCDEA